MKKKASISLAVTSDIHFDQRMIRICTSLASNSYDVHIYSRSSDPSGFSFRVSPLQCTFQSGFLGYLEYNIRLFIRLLQDPSDIFVAIDLDTILPCYLVTLFRRKRIVYDAHEYFVESPELSSRPLIRSIWSGIAWLTIPFIKNRYTVNKLIGDKMSKHYGGSFSTIRNVPIRSTSPPEASTIHTSERIILYQGVLNVGRGLEEIITAMEFLPWASLWIAGDGDLVEPISQLARKSPVHYRIHFLGKISPDELKRITPKAWLGLNLLDLKNLNYYYSLANKFFDYMHAGIPCLTMDTPIYRRYNEEIETAILIEKLDVKEIVQAVSQLYQDSQRYSNLVINNKKAALIHHWENEEQKLLDFYDRLL